MVMFHHAVFLLCQIVRETCRFVASCFLYVPYFCDFFARCLSCSEKRQKIRACFRAFPSSNCVKRCGLSEWIGLSLLEWIEHPLPEWIGLPLHEWIEHSLHGWIGHSLGGCIGFHSVNEQVVTQREDYSFIFRCYFQKNPDTFQKSKCKHKPLFCCSMTIHGHSTNPEVGRMDAIQICSWLSIYIWCSLWAANVSTKYKSNV